MSLRVGTILHAPTNRPCDSKSGPHRWRVNGQCRSWVRNPERFELPVKYGLYGYDYITELNAPYVHLESECEVTRVQQPT